MPKLLRLPLPRRSARQLASGVCALVFSASVYAQVLQSWEFNDPAGTALPTTVNSIPGGASFSPTLPGVATDGAGTLKIEFASPDPGWTFADIPDVSTGKLQLDVNVAGWDFTNLIGEGPLLEVGFANISTGTDRRLIRTAHLWFSGDVDGSIGRSETFLAGVAGPTGGNGASPAMDTATTQDTVFGIVQTAPVTFRLVVDFDTLAYSVSTSVDGFTAQATGTIASGKAARFVTIRTVDDFTIGGTGGNIRIDSITLTRLGEAPVLTLIEAWRVLHFETAVNTGDAADNADPDGDGIPNLLEYATGTNPKSPNLSPTTLGLDGAGRLTLAYTSIADPALTYTVEATSDLTATWSPILTATGGTLGSGAQVTPDTAPFAPGPRRFLRLIVTYAP